MKTTTYEDVFDEVGFSQEERELFRACLETISDALERGEDPMPSVRGAVEREIDTDAVQEH